MVYYLLKDSIPRFQGKENFQIKRMPLKVVQNLLIQFSCASRAIPANGPNRLATRTKKNKTASKANG